MIKRIWAILRLPPKLMLHNPPNLMLYNRLKTDVILNVLMPHLIDMDNSYNHQCRTKLSREECGEL